MKTASRPPLRRLVALDRMIRSGRYPNARSAARELEVHPRTVHRDLEFLRDSWDAPLQFSHEHNGFYYQDKDYALPHLRLTQGQLIALFLAERLMQQYRGTPYARDLAAAFRKLTDALPDQVTVDLSHLDQAYSFRAQVRGSGSAELFRKLCRAVQNSLRLELIYWTASRDETCARVVDPYHLTSVDGEWYLVAYCHLREAVRMFVPSRIRSLRETRETFERPADFRVSEYLDGALRVMRGTGPARIVRLHFAREIARFIREKVWHPTQRLQERKDGSLIVKMKLSHLSEVKRWVLSYGAACKVLEPAELRRQVQRELRASVQQYGGSAEPFPGFPEDFA